MSYFKALLKELNHGVLSYKSFLYTEGNLNILLYV